MDAEWEHNIQTDIPSLNISIKQALKKTLGEVHVLKKEVLVSTELIHYHLL